MNYSIIIRNNMTHNIMNERMKKIEINFNIRPAFNECTSCSAEPEKRELSNGIASECLCMEGYFDDGESECKLCHYSCLGCWG